MLTISDRKNIITLLQKEVTPAIGCTEPAAVALAVAKAREVLGKTPQQIDIFLSTNILKNAMGVGIPGTGMVGLPIAIAMGALVGKSEYGLEVLRDVTPESICSGKEYLQTAKINIQLKENVSEKLYIEIIAISGCDTSRVIISREHSLFTLIEFNKQTLHQLSDTYHTEAKTNSVTLLFNTVCSFALETPLEEIAFIKQSSELNKAAATESVKGNYGHGVSLTLANGQLGDNVFTRMLSVTAAACDARMGGAMFPVMSNSGSGNQGIAATLPVTVFAEERGKSEEELIRALTLSHLMTIYIKQSLGRLSGLCGAIVAATGAACGITYLMGGSREQIAFAIKNMIGNITGMICDGAKPSCALKVSNGVSTATLSALMAMDNKVVTAIEGITDEDVDKTILNLTKIGRDGMNETDKLILEIMTNK